MKDKKFGECLGITTRLPIMGGNRHKQEKVDWHRLVWFQFHIPRYALIAWMVLLDKLPTRIRLSKWGHLVSVNSLFCNQAEETRDHLLFT